MPRDSNLMLNRLISLDPKLDLSLQRQLREQLVAAVFDGRLAINTPLPSSRELARQLSVSRNTVVLAYQHLQDEGIIVSSERRGYFVNPEVLAGHCPAAVRIDDTDEHPDWLNRVVLPKQELRQSPTAERWKQSSYRFVCGQLDPNLIPFNDWRECCRSNLSIQAIADWSADQLQSDHPQLLEQLSRRVLPRRGIWVDQSNILVTLGAQNALYLIAKLLMKAGVRVAMENPGYADARRIFTASGATIVPIPVDQHGLVIDAIPKDIDYVYVTPAHQAPTMVKLSQERREILLQRAKEERFIVIEDDYETEANYFDSPTPSLKSIDHNHRVIYVSSLSKAFAPGLRTGYLVAHPGLIESLRELRFLMYRHPPANNQRQIARFIALGHYDALMARRFTTLKERWKIVDQYLRTQLPMLTLQDSRGGTSFWIDCSELGHCEGLVERAIANDVYIETGCAFWLDDVDRGKHIRIGVSAISTDKIEAGLEILKRVFITN